MKAEDLYNPKQYCYMKREHEWMTCKWLSNERKVYPTYGRGETGEKQEVLPG